MARNYDKTYLNELIAKAKKSWEGVDVDSYMKNLRDDSIDKEVAEKLSKEVASYITEQIKSNMDKETIRCRDLMVGDWITDEHGFPMQITTVGEDYAYATFVGLEGDPWEFCDKAGFEPAPIPLTDAFFKDNGWKVNDYSFDIKEYAFVKDVGRHHLNWRQGVLCIWFNYDERNGFKHTDTIITVKYVHQLQQVSRLAGMTDMANNFKI